MTEPLHPTGIEAIDGLRELQVFADQCFSDPADKKTYLDQAAQTDYADAICDLRGRYFAVEASQLLYCRSENLATPAVGTPFMGKLRGFGHFAIPQLEMASICLTFDDPLFVEEPLAEIAQLRNLLIRAPIRSIVSLEFAG